MIFETGYGPSGLPHIGTFGEVARTTMVRHAFRVLTDDKVKTRLIAFSDDMDGLRKVPDNVPNKDMLAAHLGKPLTQVPRSVRNDIRRSARTTMRGCAPSSITFGFDYEFLSSTDCYKSGRFDATLMLFLQRFDAVMEIMLPSLREERAQTYSPFLPISSAHRRRDAGAGRAECRQGRHDRVERSGHRRELRDAGHRRALQAAMEARLGDALGRARHRLRDVRQGPDRLGQAVGRESRARSGAQPPEGFNYELFLDEKGQKISKSKGNGLTIDEWLRYASPGVALAVHVSRAEGREAALFRRDPARRSTSTSNSSTAISARTASSGSSNPVWHIHAGNPPKPDMPLTFQLMLTLVSSSNAENAETLWGFIGRYRPGVTPQTHPKLDAHGRLRDQLLSGFRRADEAVPRADRERAQGADRPARRAVEHAGAARRPRTSRTSSTRSAGASRSSITVKKGKDGRPGVSLDWFNMLYQVLLGQEKGPRFGSFVAVYGVDNAVGMIDGALARSA